MTTVQTTQDPVGHDRQAAHHPALDGLRGAAVLAVLLFHTGVLPGGFLGVDLFFVLSGYLITGLLLREIRDSGRVAWGAFLARRARRILPALAVVVVTVTLVVRAAGPRDLVRTTLADGPWVQANLLNWHLVAVDAGYWEHAGVLRVFEHLWSIAVEEQFYAVWPLVVLLVARGRTRPDHRVALVATVLCILSFAWMAALAGAGDPTRPYIGTDTRASSLLLGAVSATAPVARARARSVRALARTCVPPGAVALLLLAGILASWFLVRGEESPALFRGGMLVHSAASAALVGWCVDAPGTAVARLLGRGLPVRLGRLSYSLYLWHWPVVVLGSVWLPGATGWAGAAVFGGVSTLLAAVSKRFVEDPVRFRARWARGWTGALVLLGVNVGVALLWVLLPGPDTPVIDVSRLEPAVDPQTP
ncbi:acyltransferase [Phycicoccus sp. CSK15P-2]|uniref:acyltransferase family protein n=1 Tax=Phycicoccus sp. CSK15P-2 TaxID=2807627 RepID=UPI0019509EC2|nr:acyltransferase [Phycicoccus sp. CSK15P-2]MBM6406112.1 acyltransferase [Phycicoccus sp. CSK15P-2]